MTTKAGIVDLMRLQFDGPAVIVLPVSDKLATSDLAKRLKGPHELVVHDPAAKSDYKRLVYLLPLFGEIAFQLPKPTIAVTAVEAIELVAEVDARLTTPPELEAVRADPLRFIRETLAHVCSEFKDEVSFYALRVGKHATAGKDQPQFQCILKAPKKRRAVLLEASGQTVVLVRDFLDRNDQHLDLSVVPCFWQPTVRELNEVRIVLQGVKGCAGLALTRRGLAPRAWDSGIAAVRRAVLPTDGRLTKDNISVVPKVQFQSTGWPAAIEPASVVSSTLQAVGLAPVPSKAFRSGGVHGWILGFSSVPTVLRFTLDINTSTHEILLVEEDKSLKPRSSGRPPVRQQGKFNDHAGVSHASKSEPQPPRAQTVAVSSHDAHRIQALEARFDKLESRQTRMEEKVDSRFSEISSSLRQLLHAAGNHPREPTGETPAPKHQRHDGQL